MKRIFIVGSINTDMVINAPYVPASGETVTGSGFFTANGGKGANQAVACAKLGGDVRMCGCVGDDPFGKAAVKSMQLAGVDVSHIRAVGGVSTGTAVITVIDGDNRIILDRGANAFLSQSDIDGFLADAEEGDIFLTQLENPVEIIAYGMKKAREKGLYVVLNPAPADKLIKGYLKYCDLLVPNESETELLGGKESLTEITDNLLVTLGSKGYMIKTKQEEKIYPCIKVKAVDTTAAGDTLCGGLCAALAEGKTLEEAAKFGSIAASLACTKKGAQPSIPSRDEVEKYI